jgi:hypothetical protein
VEATINIFYVDSDPAIAASSLVDKHVVKMVLETAQLLSTAHRVMDGIPELAKTKTGRQTQKWRLADSRDYTIYQAAHVNHPSAVWCRQSVSNYQWLVDHFFGLIEEYKFRYNKNHKSEQLAFVLQSPPLNVKKWDWTPMPSCMDTQYIISKNPIDNYRNYYNIGKRHIHKWTSRNQPEWII